MTEKPTLLVWDLPVRVFHWTLLILVVVALATSEGKGIWFQLHLASGYGVMALVVFRIAWGGVGTYYARFREFVRPWPAVRAYAVQVLRLEPAHYVGHNPLGGWMVVALLVVLVLMVATGLFAGHKGVDGPLAYLAGPSLAGALRDLHDGLNAVLWTLVTFHVAGVVVKSLMTGENLVRAMWTGKKELAGAPVAAGPVNPLALTASLALAVAAVVSVAW